MASPLLKFALIGRQSSGKTCMLTALGSSRETNPREIFCSLSRNKNIYESCIELQEVKDFFTISNSDNADNTNIESEKIDTYDEMRQRTEGMIEDLKNGILPEGTSSLSRTAFIYNFSTSNKTQFDVAIFDYAGELVSNKQKVAGNEDSEQKEKNLLSQKLLTFFEKMNGLIVAAEICESDDDEVIRKHSLDLKDTVEFFKAIENDGSDKARFNIPVCLIITKFDKFSEFNFDEYYKRGMSYLDDVLNKYFSTKRGRCIRDLAKQIESVTENNCFKVFPTISLGNYAETKSINFPLKAVGILEPFEWSAITYADILNKELTQSLKPNGLKNILSIYWESLLNSFGNKAMMLCRLSPESSELFESGKKLKEKANFYRAISIGIIPIFCILCLLGSELLLDIKDVFYLKNTPVKLENIDYSIKYLSNYSESNTFRHLLSNLFCYSKKEAVTRRNDLLKEKEKLIKEYEEKQKILLAEKEKQEKELKYKKDFEEWEQLAQNVENDLDKLERGLQTVTDEVFFSRLSNNVSLCQRKYIDSYNQSERLNKIINTYSKYSDYYKTKVVSKEFTVIYEKLNPRKAPESWAQGADLLWDLHSNPIVETERWEKQAANFCEQYIVNIDTFVKKAKVTYDLEPDWKTLYEKINSVKNLKTTSIENIFTAAGRRDMLVHFENSIEDLWYHHIKSEYDKLKDLINKNADYSKYLSQKSTLKKKAEELKNFIDNSDYKYLNNISGLENYIKELNKAASEFTSGTIIFGSFTAKWEKRTFEHTRYCLLTCNRNNIVDFETKGKVDQNDGWSNKSIHVQASSYYTFSYFWIESNVTPASGCMENVFWGSELISKAINSETIDVIADKKHFISVSLSFQPDVPELRGEIKLNTISNEE